MLHLVEHVEVVVAGDAVVRSQQIDFKILHRVARESRKYRGADRAENLPYSTITWRPKEKQSSVYVAARKASGILD